MSHWTPNLVLDGFSNKTTKLTIARIECTFIHKKNFGHDILVYFF